MINEDPAILVAVKTFLLYFSIIAKKKKFQDLKPSGTHQDKAYCYLANP